MFMSPRDVGQTVTHYGDFGYNSGGTPRESMSAWRKSRVESKDHNNDETGMGASIRADGVKKPIEIYHGMNGPDEVMLMNGHHRTLAQEDADPDRLMPVIHHAQGAARGYGNFGLSADTARHDPTGEGRR